MVAQDGETGERRPFMADESAGDQVRREPPAFEKVSDRDLITLADVLCRSLEYHSMLVAWKVMAEIGSRNLWPAVIGRRAHSIQRSASAVSDGDAHRLATEQIQHFRNEHFPIDPEEPGEEPPEAPGGTATSRSRS